MQSQSIDQCVGRGEGPDRDHAAEGTRCVGAGDELRHFALVGVVEDADEDDLNAAQHAFSAAIHDTAADAPLGRLDRARAFRADRGQPIRLDANADLLGQGLDLEIGLADQHA